MTQPPSSPPPSHRTEDAPPVPPDLISAVVPENILHGDEIVLLLLKPSLWFIIYTSFRFILTTMLLGVLTVHIVQYAAYTTLSASSVALLAVVVSLGRFVWALLVWTSHTYMLTNQRIVTIKGVVNVHMFQAPLRKIQRTDLAQPLLLRLFSTGTLGFATAATTTFDSTWVMIAHPLETHRQIAAAIERAS